MTRLRVTVFALVIIAAFLVLPCTAGAVWSNEDCQFCHADDPLVPADFSVGQVNRDVSCRKCHLTSLSGAHPFHKTTSNCLSCHPKWGSLLPGNVPTYLGSAGSFGSSESQNASPGVLHAIHLNPRWPASVTSKLSNCRSCHAIAACSACHEGTGAPLANHSLHSTETITPWTGNVSVGTNEAQSVDGYVRGYQQRCGATNCHNIESIALGSPSYMDSFAHSAMPGGWVDTVISRLGNWVLMKGGAFSNSQEWACNDPSAESSVTVSGRRVAITGTKDRYHGIMRVTIDNGAPFTIDQYSWITMNQRTLWMSGDLGPGTHTIKIEPTGAKNSNARSAYISWDHLTVYATGFDTLKSSCATCHVAQSDSDLHHAGELVRMDFAHDMTETITSTNTVDTGYGTYSCIQCHQTSMRTEHRRTTASSYIGFYDGCVVCHPTSDALDPTRSLEASYALRRDSLATSWTGTYPLTDGCNFQECHTAKYSRIRHNYMPSKHTTTTAGDGPACTGCHPGDLRVVHYNSIPGNTKVETNGCLSCHNQSKLDTDRTCSAAGCHLGGYGLTTTHPIKLAASHVASAPAKPFTRAYQGLGTLDDAGLECSVCHSSGLIPAHADAPATSCTTGGAGGKGCHLDNTYNSISVASTKWTTRKCSECHDSGSNRSHDTTTVAHLVTSNGCAGSAANCHPSNDLWALHAIDYFGSPVPGKGCDVAGCHDLAHKDVRPTKNITNSCGSTSTGCHLTLAIDHVTNYQHAFTTTSYYNPSNETGCTNKAGCHNAGGTSVADFGNDFHPASGCLEGDCHGSNPSKPAFVGAAPVDCQECHATGLYSGAAARTALTAAPASGGHYNETTHTATGLNASINSGGTGSATCLDCHPNTVGGLGNGLMNQHATVDIPGSPYVPAVGCGECHADTRSYGLAEVIANWTNNTCADCHKAGGSSILDHASSVPAVAEVGSACGNTGNGCHPSTDLHSLHKNTSCAVANCHILGQQTQRPTAKGCGGATSCHVGYTGSAHGPSNGNETTHTASGLTAILDVTYNAGGSNTCNVCHSSGLETAHGATITGNLTWSSPMCTECHNSAAPVNSVNVIKTTKWPAKSCEECHGAPNGAAKHTEYVTGHVGTDGANTCASASCHGNTYDLRALHNNPLPSGGVAGCAVTGCHDSANKEMQSSQKACGTGTGGCHGGYADDHAASYQHTFTSTSQYTSNGTTESGCTNKAGCHDQGGASVLDFGNDFHPNSSCFDSACHLSPSKASFDTGQPGYPYDCQECHAAGLFTNAVARTNLQASYLSGGHYNETTHTASGLSVSIDSGGIGSATCLDCHPNNVGGAGNGLMNQHTTLTGSAYYGAALICGECHDDSHSYGLAEVIANWTNGTCVDCHKVGGSSILDHASGVPAVAEVGSSCGSTGDGCHNSTDLHGLHKDTTCDVANCHILGQQTQRPTIKGCGGAYACHNGYTNSAHGSFNGTELQHQANGLTSILDATYNAGGANTCDTCHSAALETAHGSTITGNLAWSAPMCLECHNSTTPVDSIEVIKTTIWPGKNCEECHGAPNGPAKHAEYVTGHTGSDGANTCTTASCHGNTYDLRVIHNDQIAGGDPAGCDVTGCHDSLNKEMQSGQKQCGSGTGGCHGVYTDSHASGSAHPFTVSSYYTKATETGCTNQAGCHNPAGGSVSDYSAWYHPDSGCETGACHQDNTSKAGYSADGDCDTCHDNNYDKAPDRVAVNGAFPNGHYSETTHTAASMTTSLSAGGSASATCNSCHSPTLGTAGNAMANQHQNLSVPGSPYGATLECGECHGDVRVNGLSEVTGDWSTNACIDCHAIGNSFSPLDHAASVPAVQETVSSCGSTGLNCHNETELHALHKDATSAQGGCNLTDCHDFNIQGNVVPETGCDSDAAQCHQYTYDTHSHSGDAALHQPTTSSQASATQFGVACGACHDIRTSGASLTLEHEIGTSVKTQDGANNCYNCHHNTASTPAIADNWSAKDSTNACLACHTVGNGMGIHTTENIGAHSTEANTGCASTGIGCHDGVDLTQVGSTATMNDNIHANCLRCHDYTGGASWSEAMIGTGGNLEYSTTKKCGQGTGCHLSDRYNPVSGVHRVGRGDVVNGSTDVNHTDASMGATIGVGVSAARNLCSSCHSTNLAGSHATAMTGWTNTCTGCHNSTLASNVSPTQVKAGWATNDCLDCHTAGASATKVANQHSIYGTASHNGVPFGANTCDESCHSEYDNFDLGHIHRARPNGCGIGPCHGVDKPMGAVTRTCGGTSACHNGYIDGNHGFNETMHTTTSENSWKNCGRCHLGHRPDYTRTGTYNGDLLVDTNTDMVDLHENSAGGGIGCPTCHDSGATQALIDAGATVDCESCHVDHRIEVTDYSTYTTKSTSSENLAKTININFSEQDSSNIGFWLATDDNATSAYARIEVGPNGSEFITTSTVTSAMDPLRKKFYFKNLDVSSIEGTQPVRLYVYSGSAATTAVAEHFEVCVSRGTMITKHSANVSGFTCSFGDCHDANVVAQHQPYEIPGAFTGTWSWDTLPSRENLAAVMSGATAGTMYKVKSLTVNMHDVDKIRLKLNIYGTTTKPATQSWEVRIGSTVIANGSVAYSAPVKWWDYSPGNNDPGGTPLNYISTAGLNGNTTFDLYLSCSSTTQKTANNTFQLWTADRIYEASTPTDACDLCHLNKQRIDGYGAYESEDATLGPDSPKLASLDPQCDTCHPAWQAEHPKYSHRSSAAADTCLSGCHQYRPAIVGTDLGLNKYDLTKQHVWGDNPNTGISYQASTTILSYDFGTSASWPTTWTRSDATYVTNQNVNIRTGYAPQIGVVNGVRNTYSFNNTTPFDLSLWRGGTVQFWYKINVSDAADYLICEYTTTSTAAYTPLFKVSTDQLTMAQSPVLTVPGDGPIYIRFRGAFNATGEYAAIDDFVFRAAGRTLPGTMEGGCGYGPNGACHAQDYPTTGKCSDCHTAVNHHNVIHDLSVAGTRTAPVQTGYTFDSCLGVCHSKSLHYAHGVGLGETEPRPYRGVGETVDGTMSCATCHDSANAAIKFTSNSATNSPIANHTLMCATCHTGSASMATTPHAGPLSWPRTSNILTGANLNAEFNNTNSVSGHRVPPYTNAFNRLRFYDATKWYATNPGGKTQVDFNNFTAAAGAVNAAALLRKFTVDETGIASGTALKNGSNVLSTSVVVHCADCHGTSAANMEGPQGAATAVTMMEGFSTRWVDQTNNGGALQPTLICSRCHDTKLGQAGTAAHNSNGGHSPYGATTNTNRCIACHVAIPHAWKRPKLLVSITRDVAPYEFNPGTATGSSLEGWDGTLGTASVIFNSSGNCNTAGCKGHGGTDNVP